MERADARDAATRAWTVETVDARARTAETADADARTAEARMREGAARARVIAERLVRSGADAMAARGGVEAVVVTVDAAAAAATTADADAAATMDDFDAFLDGCVREEEMGAVETDADEVVGAREVDGAACGGDDARRGGVASTDATEAETRGRAAETAEEQKGDAPEASKSIDLTTMFPSSKRRPMGTLGGFEEVMRVKKKRAKRMPKPKYDPTPKLLDDDLVALPAQEVSGFIEEDDYDDLPDATEANIDEDEDVEDTDVEDSPQVTETVPEHLLFPSSATKRPRAVSTASDASESDTATFGGGTELAARTEDNVLHTTGVADVEDGEEVTQPEETTAIGAEEEKEEEFVFALPGRPVSAPTTTKRKRGRPRKSATPAPAPACMFPGKPVAAARSPTPEESAPANQPMEPDEKDSRQEKSQENAGSSAPNSSDEAVAPPKKQKSPKIVADTLLAKRVLQLIQSRLDVADVTKAQSKIILRKSMHKITATVPKKYDPDTEEGTRAFLSVSRSEKISNLIQAYVTRLKARASSKMSTPQTPPVRTPYV